MYKEKRPERMSLEELREYRTPKALVIDDYPWPACPTCGTRGHRDYSKYCSECGQRLRWTKPIRRR